MATDPRDLDAFEHWASKVELRLFADSSGPTLTVSEQIAAKVGDRIIAGSLAPGARLGEQELADEFATSRGPIREAIRILEREGLAVVLSELFEVRAGLYEIVVRKLAETRPPELLAVMRGGVARLESLVEEPAGGNAYAETVHRLMQISARFAGNERLRRMMAALSLQSLRYSKLGLASVERRRRSVRLWKQATKALERGDAEQMMLLARQRAQDSAEEASRVLADAGA